MAPCSQSSAEVSTHLLKAAPTAWLEGCFPDIHLQARQAIEASGPAETGKTCLD
ncbi:hypothetical protein BD311DRAFT_745303 [Dichomitus squalens]|uniref:Uncharacterized protein n=1 Tax=Dichomitus squalens TaxID=114155 RepID=A0A4Q9N331_9APHY|nr:hypothetical protein BD311DRAFT_745303 [Dichomitus squalens]